MGKDVKKTMRLDRLLSNLGYGGRKEMAMAIKNGWVDIDGEVIKQPSLNVNLKDVRSGNVKLEDETLDPLPPLTVMLHKPAGYTCSHRDSGKLVYDLLPKRWHKRKPSFSSIGRLDKHSSGQLLFTDDGDLLHRIIHPKTHAKKYYQVTLRDNLKGNESELFASGDFYMDEDDKVLKPAKWTANDNKSGIMILSEGRYHQVRRMFETLGNKVITLHRFQTGGLELGDLPEGEWKALSDNDLAAIFKTNIS